MGKQQNTQHNKQQNKQQNKEQNAMASPSAKNDKKWYGDVIWIALFIGFTFIIVTKSVLFHWMNEHPYFGGFVKFALLATMGELLVGRVLQKRWTLPPAFAARVAIWGFLGMVITLIFKVFSAGVVGAMQAGLLPFEGNAVLTALLISTLMNLTFAPTMMAFHRFTDAYLDICFGQRKKPTVSELVQKMDFVTFIGFVIQKTIPLFWIPAHTITFLLPSEFRVVVAAYLSIALGLLLAIAKSKAAKSAKSKAAQSAK